MNPPTDSAKCSNTTLTKKWTRGLLWPADGRWEAGMRIGWGFWSREGTGGGAMLVLLVSIMMERSDGTQRGLTSVTSHALLSKRSLEQVSLSLLPGSSEPFRSVRDMPLMGTCVCHEILYIISCFIILGFNLFIAWLLCNTL